MAIYITPGICFRQKWFALFLAAVLGVFPVISAWGADQEGTEGASEGSGSGPRVVPAVVIPQQDFLLRYRGDYENYSFTGYENYKTIRPPYVTSRRAIYDPMGDFLMGGINVFDWRETRRDPGYGRTGVSKSSAYRTLFDYVLIGSENWGRSSAKLIIADEIRTRFTPLTFQQAQFNGLRGDIATPNNKVSILLSEFPCPKGAGRNPCGDAFYSSSDQGLLIGGRWERKIGLLNIGGTFINAHVFDRNAPPGRNPFFKGAVNQNISVPMIIAVRVSDDSPDDGRGGPVVFDLRININGERRDDLKPDILKQNGLRNYTSIWNKDPSDPTGQTYVRNGYALFIPAGYFQWNRERFRGWTFPLYADYLYRMDIERGGISPSEIANPDDPEEMLRNVQVMPNDVPLRADGDDILMYYFDLTGEPYVRSVSFDALVGNDYRIDLAEIGATQTSTERDFYKKKYTERYQPTYYHVAKRAPGNVQDLSNIKWVHFEVGSQTGLSIYGLNFSTNIRGLKINAEVAGTTLYSRYPDGRPAPNTVEEMEAKRGRRYMPERHGDRFGVRGIAYYINVLKNTPRFGFGGEYFSIGPDYTTTLLSYGSYQGAGMLSSRQYAPWDFVEDNDDNDRFPDLNSLDPVPGIGSHGYEPDGVFPGKDVDKDGIPDTNRNQNSLPDYVEPFLMYDVDPDEYVYGVDMNNNGVIDEREDDREPEYPYDKDLRGVHLFLRVHLRGGLSVTLGRLDSRQIAGEGINKVDYGKVTLQARKVNLGELFAEYKLKDVQDNIQNNFFKYTEEPGGVYDIHAGYGALYTATYMEDVLDYKNSLVHMFYVSGTLTPLLGLNVGSDVKVEVNRQRKHTFEDGTFQSADRLSLLTVVNKVDYTWRLGRLELMPAFKLQYLKRTRRSMGVPLSHEIRTLPIFKVAVHVTPKTTLRGAAQGVPGFEYRLVDLANARNEFKERTYLFDVVNSSDYWGYKVWANVGLKFEHKRFLDPFRAAEKVHYTAGFVRVVLGY